MRYAARTDANQREMIQALERLGWTVKDTSRYPGFCDAIAHRAGALRLLEFKVKGGKLTPAQVEFQASGFPVVVIRTVEDCAALR